MIYVIILHNGQSYDDAWESPIAYAMTEQEAQNFIDNWSSPEKQMASRDWDDKQQLINAKYRDLYPAYVYPRTVKTPTHSRAIAPEMHAKYAADCKAAKAEYAAARMAYDAAYKDVDAAKAAEMATLGPRPYSFCKDLCHIEALPSVIEWKKE